MQGLETVAPAFADMAHGIVYCSVATVDRDNRPRSRILHPIWEWDGERLVGWVGTSPTPLKRTHLDHSPHVSCSYWSPNHDNCTAECRAEICVDDETCRRVWDLFKSAPEPVGYDPAMLPHWDRPESDAFAVMRLDPWRLRVFPGTFLMGQGGEILDWRDSVA